MADLLLQSGSRLLYEDASPMALEETVTPVGITVPTAKPVVFVSELRDGAVSATDQRLITLVEVIVDGRVEAVVEDVLDGSVTLDANSAVRGRMSLVIAATSEWIVTGPDSLLAPFGNELRISRGLEHSDRIELVRLGTFRIDQANCSDTIAISGQDRAARFIGSDGSFETSGQVGSGADPFDTIEFMLAQVYPDVRVAFPSTAANLPALAFEEGDDRWAFCQGIVQSLGGVLYFNRDGVATASITPLTIPDDPIAEIAEGEDGVMLGIERDWNRENTYNRVIVTGENPDSTDDVPRGEAKDDDPFSPTNYFGPFGRKTYRWSNTFISLDDQAADAAKGILARTLGAPDTVAFEATVDPARGPDDVVRIRREVLGLAENHILDSVTIPLAYTGTMSANTRAAQVIA